IERAVIVATEKKLDERDLPAALSAAVNAQQRKGRSLAQVEAEYITETLAATGGNKTECARILGISRKNLYEKIARYKLLGGMVGLRIIRIGKAPDGRLAALIDDFAGRLAHF